MVFGGEILLAGGIAAYDATVGVAAAGAAAAAAAEAATAAYWAGFAENLAIAVAFNAAALLLTPNQKITGPRLQDLKVSTSTYGVGIALPFGSQRVAGNLIWAMDLIENETNDIPGGGGGGKSDSSDSSGSGAGSGFKGFEYFGNFAFGVCAGEIELIRRIWADGKLVVDLTGESDTRFKYGAERYRIYLGGERQEPDPLIVADKGDTTPAHRGLAYVVFDFFPLKDFGNRIPNMNFELVRNPSASATKTVIGTSVGARDNSVMDPIFPFIYDVHGGTLYKNNRFTGDNLINQQLSTNINAANYISTRGVSTAALDSLLGTPFIDPFTGDIYIGHVYLTATNMLSVWDRNGAFVELHFPSDLDTSNVGAKKGFLLPVNEFQARLMVISTGTVGNTMRSFLRSVNPPFDIRGTLGPELDSITVGNTNLVSEMFDYAYDPSFGEERVWIMVRIHDGTSNEMNIISVSREGLFSEPTKLTIFFDSATGDESLGDPGGFTFDTVTGNLIVVTTEGVFKLDAETYEVVDHAYEASDGGVIGSAVGPVGFATHWWWNIPTVAGDIDHLVDNGSEADYVKINTTTLNVVNRVSELDLYGPTVNWTQHGPLWDPLTEKIWITDGGYTTFSFREFTSGTIPLSSIVNELLTLGGVSEAERNTTVLTDAVVGYVISEPTNVRAAIEPLQLAYFFDAAEIDFQLKFFKRTTGSVLFIPNEDLIRRPDTDPILETRVQSIEVPRRVSVSYNLQANDYEVTTQLGQRTSKRSDQDLIGETFSDLTKDIKLPIVLTDDEAARIAAINVHSAFIERMTYSFAVSNEHLKLDPTDVVTIEKITDAGTRNFVVRITEGSVGESFATEFKSILFDPDIYSTTVTGVTSPVNPAPPIGTPVPSEIFLMNLPAIDGVNDSGGMAWFAAAPQFAVNNPIWNGAVLFKAVTLSDPFAPVASVPREIGWGLVKNSFAVQPQWTVFDDENTLDVIMLSGFTPVSVTDLQLFEGINYLYLEDTGELLQYGTVEQIDSTNYTLSHFLRARLGTELNMTVPSENSRAVFVDAGEMAKFSNLEEKGLPFYYSAVSVNGSSLTPPSPQVFTNTAQSLKPLSPADIRGTRDGSNNLTVTGKRRTRFNGNLRDFIDVPLNETLEKYEMDILSFPDTNFEDVKLLVSADENFLGQPGDIASLVGDLTRRQTTVVKVGTTALEFLPDTIVDPAQSFVAFADSDNYHIGAEPFTIEMWIRFKSLSFPSTTQTFAGQYTSAGNERSWYLGVIPGNLRFAYSTSGTSGSTTTVNRTWSPVVDTWYHLAVTRDGAGDLRLFVDGTQLGATASGVTATFHNADALLYLGKFRIPSSTDSPFNGFIDSFRLTIGTARYTGSFTPNTTSFQNGADDAQVVRTITALHSLELVYSAALQTSDGFTPGDPVTVDVYQISEAHGRGWRRRATV